MDHDHTPEPFREYHGERNPEEFWEEASPQDEPVRRRWYIPVILLLLIVGAPWYWTAGQAGPTFAGLPVWVWITIASTFGLALLTAFMALVYWKDAPPKGEDVGPRGGPK